MNGNSRNRLLRDLQDKEARDAYVEGHVRAGIAYQIRAMRETEGWSQSKLGQRMGSKPQAAQAAITRLENPDYGRFSVSTLLEVASAFDVALMVRFVSFGDLLRHVTYAAPSALSPVAYTHDVSAQPLTSKARAARLPIMSREISPVFSNSRVSLLHTVHTGSRERSVATGSTETKAQIRVAAHG